MQHRCTRLEALFAVSASSIFFLVGGCEDITQLETRPGDVGEIGQAAKVCPSDVDNAVQGIDVSYYQGEIAWDDVASSEYKFAFIRVSDGLDYPDDQFQRNWTEAGRVGIIRGVYQFLRPSQDPVAQADYLLEQMGELEPGDLPPIVDVEKSEGLGASEIADVVRRWLERVEEELGRKPIIYSGPSFWDESVASSAFGGYGKWIANYFSDYHGSCPSLPSTWDSWQFWQWSDSGSCPGIAGGVDADIFNGNLEELHAWIASNAGGAEAVCGDGACNGDETSETCAGDCPGCAAVTPAGRVIDDGEAECFEPVGKPEWWRHEAAGYADGLTWTYATEQPVVEAHAFWHLDFEMAGDYLVEVNTPAPYSQSQEAEYFIRHDGLEESVTIDQRAVDGWQELGTYSFAAGSDQWIRLDDNTGEPVAEKRQLVFDAVRLTRVGGDTGASSDTESGTDTDTSSSRDTTASSSDTSATTDFGTGWPDTSSGGGDGTAHQGTDSDTGPSSLSLTAAASGSGGLCASVAPGAGPGGAAPSLFSILTVIGRQR